MKRHILTLLFVLLATGAHAASCVWQGGTGSWTAVNTASWSCGAVPTSADDVVFNGTSGGGTVTVNFGGTVTVKSLTMGAFTGTWDNSVNNNNFAIVGTTSTAFSVSGTGTRTIRLGSATYTMSGNNSGVSASTLTNLTFVPGTSTLAFTGTGDHLLQNASTTWANLSIGAMSTTGVFSLNGDSTYTSVSITGPAYIEVSSPNIITVTNAVAWAGTSTNPIMLSTISSNAVHQWLFAPGSTMNWMSFRGVTATTGAPVATNSFDLANNTNITFGTGAGGGCLLGGWLLWRDMPGNLNDNFPAWLEKVA